MTNLLNGVKQFQQIVFPRMQSHFEHLASGQNPQALFITCSDSRVDPNLITGTLPGELFVVRNAGNIVPDPNGSQEGVLASIEYAVSVLKVPEIIVCGHSQCGAMTALMSPETVDNLPYVSKWLEQSKPATCHQVAGQDEPSAIWELTLENIRLQLERLRQLECVAKRADANKLTISGWCYKFETGDVHVVDEHQRKSSEEQESLPGLHAAKVTKKSNSPYLGNSHRGGL